MLPKVQRAYLTCALLTFNTLLCVLGINIALGVLGFAGGVEALRQASPAPLNDDPLPVYWIGPLIYDLDKLEQVYYYQPMQATIWLLLEHGNLPYQCDDDTFFRFPAYQGTYINIEPAGYRHSYIPQPWSPPEDAFTVFVFGGSTTFGYGEADNRTIPAYLHYYLREELGIAQAEVYNFGQGDFFSLQERLFFAKLLQEGHVPDLAIFIDGLNDFNYYTGEPKANNNCRPSLSLGQRLGNTLSCEPDSLCLPMQNLAQNVLGNTLSTATPAPTSEPYDNPALYQAVINRWVEQKYAIEALADEYGVQVLFVIQPVPGFGQDLSRHLFAPTLENLSTFQRAAWGYPLWLEALADPQTEWAHNVLNLAYLGEDNTGAIYVDKLHYTFGFMDEIAQAIRDELVRRSWLPES